MMESYRRPGREGSLKATKEQLLWGSLPSETGPRADKQQDTSEHDSELHLLHRNVSRSERKAWEERKRQRDCFFVALTLPLPPCQAQMRARCAACCTPDPIHRDPDERRALRIASPV